MNLINQNVDWAGSFAKGQQIKNAMEDRNLLRQQREQQAQQEALSQQDLEGLQMALASNDPDKIRAYLDTAPHLDKASSDLAFKRYGISSDEQKQSLINDMMAIGAGEEPEQVLTRRIESVQARGGDPSHSMRELEEYRKNPEQWVKTKQIAASMALNKDQYAQYKDIMNQGKPAQMTPYQAAQVEQRGLELKGKDADRELRKQELELRKLESQQKSAKNQQEAENKQIEIDQKKSEIQTAKNNDIKRIDDGIYAAEQNKAVIDDLLGNETYMDAITGYQGRIPALSDSGVEAEAYLDNIKNSMTIDNLSVMSGPLTDKDIQIIASASSRLRAGMSDKAMRKELKTIKSAYDRVIKNYEKERKDKGYKTQSPSNNVVFSNEKYGDVTEADIQKTMETMGMTREQVMKRLRG